MLLIYLSKYKVKLDKVILCGTLTPGLAIIGREHNFSMSHHIRQQKENFLSNFLRKKSPFKTQKKFFNKIIKNSTFSLQTHSFYSIKTINFLVIQKRYKIFFKN